MTTAIALPRARYTPSFPCPICEGHERMRRGENRRCHGYLLEIEPGRQLAYCARVPSHLPSPSHDLWGHWLDGEEPQRQPIHLPAPTPRPPERRRWRDDLDRSIRAIHDYGQFEVVRFDSAGIDERDLPKCMARHRDAAGRLWFGLPCGMRSSDAPLYREPLVIAALEAGAPLYIVEGESDADAIARAGAMATCNPFGAGKFQERHARTIADVPSRSPIRIVRDLDDPGLCHARKVRTRLLAAGVVAARIQMLEPATGKDVRDHLAAGQALAALRRSGAAL